MEKRWRISFEVTATEQGVKDLGLLLPDLLAAVQVVASGVKTAEAWMVEGVEDMKRQPEGSLNRGLDAWPAISRNKS